MKDFEEALTKVLPSVSKRDEALYKSLEGSLRKSRSAITSAAPVDAAPGKEVGAVARGGPMKH